MHNSTLAKWVVAALLAVPAVPMFGKPLHHHKLIVHRTTHHALISTASRRHRLVHRTGRHVALSTHGRKLTHRSVFAHRMTHKSGVRHTSLTSTSHFKVHVTKMPPTIDGINT